MRQTPLLGLVPGSHRRALLGVVALGLGLLFFPYAHAWALLIDACFALAEWVVMEPTWSAWLIGAPILVCFHLTDRRPWNARAHRPPRWVYRIRWVFCVAFLVWMAIQVGWALPDTQDGMREGSFNPAKISAQT